MLFVEHDMEIVGRFADRVLAFYDDTVIADGTPTATLADPRVQTLISRTKVKVAGGLPPMLRVSNLSVSIGPIPIIRSASFALEEGEMCGLIGRNGAGKTTLFRAIMGAIPASGTAEFDHINLLGLPPHLRVTHGIGYMPIGVWCRNSWSRKTSACPRSRSR